jgi:osmotically-inducible protein OsmY
MFNLKRIILVSATTAVITLAGCQSSQQQQSSSGRMPGVKMDDNAITENVQHDLNHDPAYKFTDVNVNTYNGIVQLSGFVDTPAQKQRATQIAQSNQGVTQVINNISLKPQPLAPTSQP